MAAFVASVGSLGRSVAAGLSSCSISPDSSMQTGTLLELIGALKIVARAGGSRPPPGARRPRPKTARQQSSDNEDRDRLPVNEEIRFDFVMLIGEDGKMVGKMSTDEALFRARGMDLDLVQLDKQDPPCVKIVDYSKLKYELQKRKKEQQKKSLAKRMDLKELKMRYNIDVHDYGVRLKSIQKFLKDGDKVKLIIQFKGRELEFKDLGMKLFDRFQEDIGEEAIVETRQSKEVRSISMVLAPNNKGKVAGQGSNSEKPNTDKNGSGDVATVAAVGGEA
ncbi:hypothetical protein GOP47_0022682 [Adiantum capillus-veneris]|uniref:Translation initiation factor IF-3 n=1 Tax=Adiantum capillus-veneris TaxID=13818 RepID=A0A9D4U615_ADICA|nr:hypothetical protein GOP47_0022682 [Adiantum capillus-veneris]